jgi:predicted DsbA family dithiol-disulfide isomerase
MSVEDRIEYLRAKGENKKVKKKKWYKRWWAILLFVLLSLLLIFFLSFSLLLYRLINNPEEMIVVLRKNNLLNEVNNEIEISEGERFLVEGRGDHSIGAEDPQFTITIFSDFSCPFCKESANILAELIYKYGDKIKIISRDIPILGDESVNLSMAAMCAGEQDLYWQMYFVLFEGQESFSAEMIIAAAKYIGIKDLDQFVDCFEERRFINLISKNISDAQFLGVSGTPAWFLDGYLVAEGVPPVEDWIEFLDTYLK